MNKRVYFHLAIIFLLGFFPLLWFPHGTLLFGHDSGMTFDPITHFIDRLNVWTERLGVGTDQSYGLLGAIAFIHSLEAFLVWVGFSIQQQQHIQFIIWFILPGLAMYFFAYNTWPGRKYLPLIASIIYMINFFLIQAWFVAERTKFSIYVALPLVAYFLLSYLNGKASFKKSIIGSGLILGFLNAGGSFPLYGGLILAMVVIFVYQNFLNFGREMLKRTLLFSLGLGVIYILLNAFWLFPYIYYILGFYNRDLALAGGAEGSLAWSTYLSKGSTFINLFRGQGIPEWYLNAYHAFAGNFLTNPILILGSFLFPLLAYGSLFLVKLKREKFYVYLFVLISLITLIFAAGPRSQLGIIFDFFILHVPGFAIFRSNFYKFDYAFWFSYGILIGFTLDVIFSKVEGFLKAKIKYLSTIPVHYMLLIVFLLGYIFYHYPILDGSFFDYSSEPGKRLSTRISVPQYVFDFGKWANQQDPIKRFLVLPEVSDTGYIAYQWGFWSGAPLNSLLTKNSFVQNNLTASQSERFLMKQMYSALLRQDMNSFSDFAEVFAIDAIVVNEDFDWKNISWGTTDPAIYEKILDNNPKFRLVKTFGRWRVYDIVDRDRSSYRITITPKLNFLQGELKNIVSFPEFDPTSPLFMADLEPANFSYFAKEATDIFVAPECIQCNLKEEFFGFNYYNPKILPGSPLYPLIRFREDRIKAQAHDFESLLNYHLTVSDRRIVETKWIVDSKEKLQFLQRAIDGYYDAIIQLKGLVSRDWGVSGKDENRLARTVNGHLLLQVSFIDSIFENPTLNIDHRKGLSLIYDEILKIKQIADQKQWVTQDITDKRYIFDLPKTGIYDIYVKKKSLSDPLRVTSSSKITLAENKAILAPVSETEDWLYFGKQNLNKKQVHLAFQDSTLRNLLEGVHPEFPDGNQGILQDDKKISLNLDSRNKCFTYTVGNLEALGTEYLVSFSYRNLTDKNDLGFYASDIKEKSPKLRVRESFIPNSRAWATHNEVVVPKNNSMRINFCNGFISISQKNSVKEREDLKFIDPGQNIIEIQGIAIYKISFPVVVFYQKQRETEKKEYVASFKKISPVEYKINVKKSTDAVTLVMRESYGKFWRFCEEGKKCKPFDDKGHFVSAGFTNGWYFADGIQKNVDLYYYPQKIYTFGAYLTIATLFSILVAICWGIFRKK